MALSKAFSVLRSTSFEPRVTSKTAVEVEVDVTSGSADLEYLVAAGPFGPYDVGACPDAEAGKDVVNRIVVYEAGTDMVIGEADLLPTERDAISSIVGTFLVDQETLPDGHSFADPSLTLDGASVPFTISEDGDSYTITSVDIAGAGAYHLRKTIVRDAGHVCEPELLVVNTATLVDADGLVVGVPAEATILLLCTPVLGGQGCTPGFWMNWTGAPPGLQPNAWAATGYYWSDPFTSAGCVNAYQNRTFLQVLNLSGGGKNALGRHTVAALLGAAHPHAAYDLTVTEVVAMFNDVFQNDANVNALRILFESYDEQGYPLNAAVYW